MCPAQNSHHYYPSVGRACFSEKVLLLSLDCALIEGKDY